MIKSALMVGCAIASLCFASNVESQYRMQAVVEDVNGDDVIVTDETGESWLFQADEIKEGDEIIIIFDEGHTTDRSDDLIVDYEAVN